MTEASTIGIGRGKGNMRRVWQGTPAAQGSGSFADEPFQAAVDSETARPKRKAKAKAKKRDGAPSIGSEDAASETPSLVSETVSPPPALWEQFMRQQSQPRPQHQVSDRNIPEISFYNAKGFRDLDREVGFWELETPLPLEKRGPALIRRLKDRAKDLTKHLMPSDVAIAGGVKVVMDALRALEKEPYLKLEEMADAFFTLNRRPGESHDEFIQRADAVRRELKKEDPTFDCNDGFWALYILRRAGITPQQRAQLLVLSNGKYDK